MAAPGRRRTIHFIYLMLWSRPINNVLLRTVFVRQCSADKRLCSQHSKTISIALLGLSGNSIPVKGAVGMVPRNGGWLDAIAPLVGNLPAEINEDDIDFYTNEYKRTGFRGGLNWYRNADRNWSLLAPWAGAKVTVPALYIVGDRDLVVRFPGADKLIPNLSQFVPQLRETTMLPGCGHWTQ